MFGWSLWLQTNSLIIRSLPVATVSLNITGFPAEVMRENKSCVANGPMTAWYTLNATLPYIFCVIIYLRFTHLCLVVHRPLHSLHYCTEWRYDPTLVNRFQSTWEHPTIYHSWGERSGVMEWHSLTHSPISIEVWSSYWETKVLSKLRFRRRRIL